MSKITDVEDPFDTEIPEIRYLITGTDGSYAIDMGSQKEDLEKKIEGWKSDRELLITTAMGFEAELKKFEDIKDRIERYNDLQERLELARKRIREYDSKIKLESPEIIYEYLQDSLDIIRRMDKTDNKLILDMLSDAQKTQNLMREQFNHLVNTLIQK